MNMKLKYKKRKTFSTLFIIIILIILLSSVSIGYSYYNTKLYINGSARMDYIEQWLDLEVVSKNYGPNKKMWCDDGHNGVASVRIGFSTINVLTWQSDRIDGNTVITTYKTKNATGLISRYETITFKIDFKNVTGYTITDGKVYDLKKTENGTNYITVGTPTLSATTVGNNQTFTYTASYTHDLLRNIPGSTITGKFRYKCNGIYRYFNFKIVNQ